MSSLKYRKERIKKIIKYWKFRKCHDLMASFKPSKREFEAFKNYVKIYISKSLGIDYFENDAKFLKSLEKGRKNRTNVTPNGGIVPKRETHLEYNLVLREWANLVRNFTKNKPEFLSRFRTTPNIRIKFGKELEDNVKRPLNTALPHSDAWVEGPWGMNCFVPIMGDTNNNTLVYYEPKKFKDEFLKTAKTYIEMQWIMKYYKKLSIIPKAGNIYVSDYALVHNTYRKTNCKTRISIDTTIFIGDHEPHKDRMKEYRNHIPLLGINEFVDAGQYEHEKHAEKISTFSHYTSRVLKTIKLDKN